ncbi:hypothetical protein SESBI_43749 [Sesbania bispinosa]|nr:hypothetical protein SESBI_43749 [Sesbania bispinosa]
MESYRRGSHRIVTKMRKKLLISSLSFRHSHHLTPKPNHLSLRYAILLVLRKCSGVGGHMLLLSLLRPPNAQKGRKKVPKHERRTMVESFVNKECWEIPNNKGAQKQVGGGYYFVREIIQELKYKSKMKSSNNIDQILVEKQFDESKLKTNKSADVSSDKIEKAKDRPIPEDSQSVLLDNKETVNTGYEHLEEKRGPQTSSWEGGLSNEVEIISTPGNHCITSESNILGKCSKEPNVKRLKTEEAVSSYSDSVASESRLVRDDIEHVSTPYNENFGTVYGKAQGHESELVDIKNHQKMEEKCIEEVGYETREKPALEDLFVEASHSSPQVPNDVKSVKAVSSCPSDSVAPERHLPKEEIEQVSLSFIEKSVSSCSEDQSHASKLVGVENHPTIEKESFEKAGYEKKEQDALEGLPGVDSPKHKMEQSQGSLELDESKITGICRWNNVELGVVSQVSSMLQLAAHFQMVDSCT